ncbi:hypothetical protein LSAT2_004626, partial [Lamellibrachia satsuma]
RWCTMVPCSAENTVWVVSKCGASLLVPRHTISCSVLAHHQTRSFVGSGRESSACIPQRELFVAACVT